MSTSQGWNFLIQSLFRAHNSSLGRYDWGVQLLENLGPWMAIKHHLRPQNGPESLGHEKLQIKKLPRWRPLLSQWKRWVAIDVHLHHVLCRACPTPLRSKRFCSKLGFLVLFHLHMNHSSLGIEHLTYYFNHWDPTPQHTSEVNYSSTSPHQHLMWWVERIYPTTRVPSLGANIISSYKDVIHNGFRVVWEINEWSWIKTYNLIKVFFLSNFIRRPMSWRFSCVGYGYVNITQCFIFMVRGFLI